MQTFLCFFGSFLIVSIAIVIANRKGNEHLSDNCIGELMFEDLDYYEIAMKDVLFFEPIIEEISAISDEVHKLIYCKF